MKLAPWFAKVSIRTHPANLVGSKKKLKNNSLRPSGSLPK